MAAYNKFNQFVEDVGLAVHNLNTDTLKVLLTLTAPVATNAVKADLTEISAGDGYTAGGEDSQNTWTETTGTATLAGVDIVWTAAAGTFADFRYTVLYNDTPASPLDPLIAWWDYGSTVDLGAGETFTWDTGASIATLT